MKVIWRMIVGLILGLLIQVTKLAMWVGCKIAGPIIVLLGIGTILAACCQEWLQLSIILVALCLTLGTVFSIALIQIVLENALCRMRRRV